MKDIIFLYNGKEKEIGKRKADGHYYKYDRAEKKYKKCKKSDIVVAEAVGFNQIIEAMEKRRNKSKRLDKVR